MALITSSFTATGAGNAMEVGDSVNVSVDFTTGSGVGTVAVQRSLDGGATWHTVESYTADAEKIADSAGGAMFRLNCTAYTSGTIAGQISYERTA